MKDWMPWIFLTVIFVIGAGTIVYAGEDNARKRNYCESHGGTWFSHEQRCIPLNSIPIPTE